MIRRDHVQIVGLVRIQIAVPAGIAGTALVVMSAPQANVAAEAAAHEMPPVDPIEAFAPVVVKLIAAYLPASRNKRATSLGELK